MDRASRAVLGSRLPENVRALREREDARPGLWSMWILKGAHLGKVSGSEHFEFTVKLMGTT